MGVVVIVSMFMIMVVMVLMFMRMPVFMVMMMLMFVIMIVMVMLVLVIMIASAALFLTIYGHGHMCAGDAALDGRFRGVYDSRDPAGIQFIEKGLTFFLRKKLEKRCTQHIACGTHGTVDVENLHFFASIWLIIPAR